MESSVFQPVRAARAGLRVASTLIRHPAAQSAPLRPLLRFAGWQLMKRAGMESITIPAFGTARLVCHGDSAASNGVVYYEYPDWDEMHFFRALLRPGDLFLDIGANVGVYSILAWSRVAPTGRVCAFEPDEQSFMRLRENFLANGMSEKDLYPMAVGEQTGTCEFEVGKDSVGAVLTDANKAGRTVPMGRLDEQISADQSPAAAKLDVEGFELSVLKGATGLLSQGLPRCILLETNGLSERYGVSLEQIQRFLASYDYTLYEIEASGFSLRAIPSGGPYPGNSLAIADLKWVQERIPGLSIG